MTHPTLAPRPSSDPLYQSRLALPRCNPLVGPYCPSCEHPSCRRRRAERLPRLGGQLAEYRNEHTLAAAVQARNPHLIVWYGERTGSYWVASSTGLAEVPDAQTLDRLLPPVFELW
ncbi:hypothetical protein GCM10007079_30730 [Nocardiopsis terrae]|uniref:Uncharacterized protein n=1 Tax=Nocardiopsis terrae TaxID=372655 RepID=A0ABR9HIP9_9ACTN|nr:hypothetical protein [Nocardiopsis terrae]MBE1458900.1 hypothetical protein [Nocardiopsis terrae]GHC86999.1 hypothetical protein GCM10007079_30730 [Nocardiopsis terrae]